MTDLIANATGIDTCPVLINDLVQADQATEFDLIVTPLFHIGEVLDVVKDENRVVEMNFVASSETLREIATLSTGKIVTAVAPRPAEQSAPQDWCAQSFAVKSNNWCIALATRRDSSKWTCSSTSMRFRSPPRT